ncbi:hypothetical protein ACQ4PT_064203 [Festuca glaucescens]
MDRRLRLLHHRHHLPDLRAIAPSPRQEADEEPKEATVRGPAQGEGGAHAAGVHLPAAQRAAGPHGEVVRKPRHHAPSAALQAAARVKRHRAPRRRRVRRGEAAPGWRRRRFRRLLHGKGQGSITLS